ncbi:hypothetical protein Q7P35_005490 [Cladosporium inversicolor]
MDAIDELAGRTSTAGDMRATPTGSEQEDAGVAMPSESDEGAVEEAAREAAEEERAMRVRRRRDMLQQELEIVAMEQQLDVLRRTRNAGHTPAVGSTGEAAYENSQDARSAAGSAFESPVLRRGHASRPRLKEPDTFKGKTLKEAREFIRSLELVFALAPEAYSLEREKILYGVMFLAGEPRETWHQNHSVQDLEGYSWEAFTTFVFDAVEDPVNRSLSTTVAYESARQGEGQTAQAFATELATLEEQMDPYTPAQRTRHLLAKLKPALRTAIITYHEVPKRREDLVSLATRLESAGKRSEMHMVLGSSHKRVASDSHNARSKRPRGQPGIGSVPKPPPSQAASMRNDGGKHRDMGSVRCYKCQEMGHYASACPIRDQSAVRKIGAVRQESVERAGPSWPARLLRATAEARGKRQSVTCLLDDAAEVNVISQSTALRCNLVKVDVPLPDMEGFRGEKGACYGAYKLRMRIADSTGAERVTDDVFFAVDLSGAEVLLGRPWRRKYGIVVDSRNDYWWFSEPDEMPAARVRDARSFQRDLRKAAFVYAVNLQELDEAVDLPEEIRDFCDVITTRDVADRPLPTSVDHAIDLEPNERPPFRPLYNLSVKELAVLREYIEQALKNGWIKRSVSEAGAPILFVPKKDGSLRLCVDYRGLNAITKKNRHPLPLISETLDRLGRATVFSALDLKDAYHRIPIKRGDEWKTAFRTRYSHFEYCVMPFGLTNALATFQAYINRAIAGLVDICCVVYLDDILVYSDTREQYVRDLRAVLERLRKFALKLIPAECNYETHDGEILAIVKGFKQYRHYLEGATHTNKLAVWKANSNLAPLIGRVRAQEKHLLGAGESVALEDPFSDPIVDLTSIIETLQAKDNAIEALQASSREAGDADAWRLSGGLWYYKGALYVPDDSATYTELMRIHYDDELASHFGRNKTEQLLRRKYWWPALSKDIAEREEITFDFITDLPLGKLNS